MLTEIVQLIAARYVEEKFADIVAQIDGGTIATAVVEEIKQRVINAMGIVQTPEDNQAQKNCVRCLFRPGYARNATTNFQTNRNWGAFPALNPEKAEYLREHNINLGTGHKNDCPLKGAR